MNKPFLDATSKHANLLLELSESDQGLFLLDNYSLLTVEGEDAEKFLQGQCTCDLNNISSTKVVLGAHCNPQGRMQSNFLLAKLAENKYALRIHKSLAKSTLADFQKYIVFSKAELSINQSLTILGLYSKTGNPRLNALNKKEEPCEKLHSYNGAWFIQHSKQQLEIWLDQNCTDIPGIQTESLVLCPDHQWDLLNIRRGLAELREETRTQLLPQEINLQLLDGVSFKKGCYTGQEVIARLHYKGKLKKHMYYARVETAEDIPPGTQILSEQKQVGIVLACAPATKDSQEILVLCKDSMSTSENVQLNTLSGAFLRWLPLPYAIPG